MAIELMVAGIGNILMKDEGVGVYLIRKLKEEMPYLYVEEIGTETFRLFEFCKDVRKLLIVDALRYGNFPGSCYLFPVDEFLDFAITLHDKHFLSELNILCKIRNYYTKIYIFGIEPYEIDWEQGLSDRMKQDFNKIFESLKIVCKEILQKERENDLFRT